MSIKKNTLLFSFSLLLAFGSLAQNVAINDNGAAANVHAVLDVDVTTNDKGILIPRITEAQKLAMTLSTSEEGLMIYQSDQFAGYWYWDGTEWVRMLTSKKAFGQMDNAAEVSDTILIPVIKTYYKIPSLTAGLLQNMAYASGSLTVQKTGYYLLSYSLSGYSINSKENFETAISVNGTANVASEIEQRFDRKVNKETSTGGSCIMYLSIGDVIELHVKCDVNTSDFVATHGSVTAVQIN